MRSPFKPVRRRLLARLALSAAVFSTLLWLQSALVAVNCRGKRASVGVGYGLLNFNISDAGSVSTGCGVTWPSRQDGRVYFAPTWWPAYMWTWRNAQLVLSINIPLWIPSLLFFLVRTVLLRGAGPIVVGACRGCRYNLTGNTSGICPECGTPMSETRDPPPDRG